MLTRLSPLTRRAGLLRLREMAGGCKTADQQSGTWSIRSDEMTTMMKQDLTVVATRLLIGALVLSGLVLVGVGFAPH